MRSPTQPSTTGSFDPPALRIETLGRFSVASTTRELGASLTQKARALLVHLVFHARVDQSRESLIEVFWPDAQMGAPRASLSTALSSIRRLIRDLGYDPESYVQANTNVIRWIGPALLDVHEFEALAGGDSRASLERASSLYHGDFLEGDFDEWTIGWREHFSTLYETVLEKLLALRPDVGYAKALLGRNPYHEAAYAVLLDDALTHKRHHLAHAIFKRAIKALDELGTDGSLALKERFGYLARRMDEPLRYLPSPATRLIGREVEVDEVLGLLSSQRLVTITGPGGIGKTRLAIEVARNSAEAFADGARLVELADCNIPEMLLGHVAAALAVAGPSVSSLFDDLAAACEGQALLLVLDNCEHLVGECARVASKLLRAIPGLTILATSREPLLVEGEFVFRVPPLSSAGSIALFSDRALAVDRTFLPFGAMTTIAAIVARLDGLPLAIEFAAARIDVMSPEQILLGLMTHLDTLGSGKRNAARRHKTLPALIDWSYDLLGEDERAALRRLGVFSGRFSLEAAEAVCGFDPIRPQNVMPLLASLARKSLLQKEPPASGGQSYFRFLQTVRSYAQDRAVSDGEYDELLMRHARYYVEFSKRIDPLLRGKQLEEGLARVGAEWENVRAALQRLFAGLNPAAGRSIILALGPVWLNAGYCLEGQFWIDHIVDDCGIGPAERAELLGLAALMAQGQADYVRLQPLAEQLIGLFETLGDTFGIAKSQNLLAIALQNRGRLDDAEHWYRLASQNYRAVPHPLGNAVTLMNLGTLIAEARNDFRTARDLLEESLLVLRELGVSVNLAHALTNLSVVALHEGDVQAALTYAKESLALYERLGNDAHAALQHIAIADCYIELGQDEHAIAALRAGYRKMGDSAHPKLVIAYFENAFMTLDQIGECAIAARLIGFVDAYRLHRDAPRSQVVDSRIAPGLKRLATHYSPQELRALREQGERLTVDQANAITEDAWRKARPNAGP